MADESASPAAEEKPAAEAPPKDEAAKEEEVAPAHESSLDRIVKTSSMQIAQSVQRLAEAAEKAKITDVRGEKYDKKAKEVVGDAIEVRRDSVVDATGVPKVARFLNTYKLEPDKFFNPEKIIDILEKVMIEAFEAYTAYRIDEEGNVTDIKYFLPYNGELCSKQAKWASETIRTKIKELEFDRYKLICIVTMGEKHNQDIYCCCRFMWDFEKDNFTKFAMENPFIFGYALVFGLYYE